MWYEAHMHPVHFVGSWSFIDLFSKYVQPVTKKGAKAAVEQKRRREDVFPSPPLSFTPLVHFTDNDTPVGLCTRQGLGGVFINLVQLDTIRYIVNCWDLIPLKKIKLYQINK
jgi:hypothetical protein